MSYQIYLSISLPNFVVYTNYSLIIWPHRLVTHCIILVCQLKLSQITFECIEINLYNSIELILKREKNTIDTKNNFKHLFDWIINSSGSKYLTDIHIYTYILREKMMWIINKIN